MDGRVAVLWRADQESEKKLFKSSFEPFSIMIFNISYRYHKIQEVALVQWLTCQTCNLSNCCFLEQEASSSLLRTG